MSDIEAVHTAVYMWFEGQYRTCDMPRIVAETLDY
jgi:hypothetical protein